MAEENTFLNNAAVVHSSNGGAITLVCDFIEALPNQASSELEIVDSESKKTAIVDPVDFDVYVVQDYSAQINANIFEGNEVG